MDPFIRQRNLLGLRSRSALKLREMDDRFKFLPTARVLVDLGCAPGGFLQIAAERMKHKSSLLVGVDLEQVDEIGPNVKLVRGDFTSPATQDIIVEHLAGRSVDGVLSDCAPNACGDPFVDGARQLHLARQAWSFAEVRLGVGPGSFFICKVFANGEEKAFADDVKRRFSLVKLVKPASSRSESREVFLYARGLMPLKKASNDGMVKE